ncbi:hypothetical protein G9A89_008670 [Geosiphon pyriformis]|nr:hypothetical protein G9A89_008670 [Geosiphon pyriformis]
MNPVGFFASRLVSVLAGLRTQSGIKTKQLVNVHLHSASYKKPKKPTIVGNMVETSASSLFFVNIITDSNKSARFWSSKINSKTSSISSISDLENIKNTVVEDTNYVDSNALEVNNTMNNIILRKTHTRTYVLGSKLKTFSFNNLSDDNDDILTLLVPKFSGAKHLLNVESYVLNKHNFKPVKSFVLNIELSAVLVDSFGKAFTLSKFLGIIRLFFISESSLNKAKELAICEKIFVNNDLKKVNSHSDREIIIKKILVDLPKLAVESVFSKFNKIALLYTFLIGTTAYNLSDLLNLYDKKTCYIGHNFSSYVHNKCVIVCFTDETFKLAVIGFTPVYKSVNLHWAGLSLTCCALCKQFGYVSGVCSVSRNSGGYANIYKKKQTSVACFVSFRNKTWAQIASGYPFCVVLSVLSNGSLSLGVIFYSLGFASFVDFSLSNHLAVLKCSLELLTDQVSVLMKKLNFMELVPLTTSSYASPPVISVFLAPVLDSNIVLNDVLVLTTKVGRLELKMMALKASVNSVLEKLDCLCSDLGLSGKVCPWIADKFDGVCIFISGANSGYLGSDVVIIMDIFLVCRV